ncbi:response regulator, partial [Pedobacter glucosidilyticus]|uniref:response regulator n=1 Tax=Pedobacter glucosidilyticus TaxID=1122941 RepID=UPI000419BCE1
MNILLVDDHIILSEGVEYLIKEHLQPQSIHKVTSGVFALATLKSTAIDLMVTDYSMPDMSGLNLVKQVKQLFPDLKVIVLTMHDEAQMVQEMVAAGVDAYLLKKYTHHELLQAITIVINGGHFWSKEISQLLVKGYTQTPEEAELTDRELEVLKLLCEELTSKEIAEKLFIGERTVETHRKNLLRKTKSTSTVGLIKYAFSKKII